MSTMSCTRQQRRLSWLQPTLSQMLKQYISFSLSAYQRQTKIETKSQEIICDRISQLPPEIIRIILLHLLSTSCSSFLQALQVSRSWADLGAPFLWSNIFIYSTQMSQFNQSLVQSNRSTKHIQSLTLKLKMPTKSKLETHLTDLSQQINRFENLTTFSLSIHSNLYCKALPISNLLRALPTSVTALELGRLPPRLLCKTVSERVCHAIQQLLPQLEHLRIDRGHICSNILPDVDLSLNPELTKLLLPRLKSILINDSNRPITSGHCCGLRDMRMWRTDLCGEEIALKASNLIDAGYMPSLESFVVLTTCSYQSLSPSRSLTISQPPPSPPATTNAHARKSSFTPGHSFFLRKDVLENKTTLHTHCAAPHAQQKWVIRQPNPDFADSSGAGYANDVKEDNTRYFVGDLQQVKTFLEGDQTWIETSAGTRFPPSFRQTRQGRMMMMSGNKDYTSNIQPSTTTPATPDSQSRNQQQQRLEYLRGLFDDDDSLTPVTYDGLLRPR